MIEDKEEIQITVNKFIEIIYEMYMKDLKAGNIVKEPVKSYGKICKKRGFINGYKNPTIFNIGK